MIPTLKQQAAFLFFLLVGLILTAVLFPAKASAAEAVITWTPHPEGPAVDIRLQTAPVKAGPWTDISPHSSGADSKRIIIYPGTPGQKLCARAKAIRLADKQESVNWSGIACDTTSKPPPSDVSGAAIKLP